MYLNRESPRHFHIFVFFVFEGMDHQGIFRVPGSNTEINDMKEAFENGMVSPTEPFSLFRRHYFSVEL